MSPPPSELLIQIISRIPLFKDLSATQVRFVLNVCEHRILEAGKILCTATQPSDEMYILVAGELAVLGTDGTRTAEITPVEPVGEAELVTGQPYTGTVEVSKTSHVFAVPRYQFERLLRRDLDLQLKIYKNITDILVDRMGSETETVVERQLEKRRHQTRVAVLERQLKLQVKKTDVALELLALKGEMSRDEAEVQMSEKLKDLIPRILVVDDEPDFRRFVKEVLDVFSVMEANNGQEALEVLRQERPDLVIADIRMPGMDGCTLLTNLRNLYPGLLVMAVSGYLEADDVENYGFDGFIDKLVGSQELQEIVEITVKSYF